MLYLFIFLKSQFSPVGLHCNRNTRQWILLVSCCFSLTQCNTLNRCWIGVVVKLTQTALRSPLYCNVNCLTQIPDCLLSRSPSNPPLSEEMLPPGDWMCHRCMVQRKVNKLVFFYLFSMFMTCLKWLLLWMGSELVSVQLQRKQVFPVLLLLTLQKAGCVLCDMEACVCLTSSIRCAILSVMNWTGTALNRFSATLLSRLQRFQAGRTDLQLSWVLVHFLF